MPSYDPALWALRTWLDSWTGIGHVARGMPSQGYDLQLTQYDERGWRATFYTTGMEHSPTRATGTAWERTPWHATQRAASEALTRGRGRLSIQFNLLSDTSRLTWGRALAHSPRALFAETCSANGGLPIAATDQ